MKPPSETWFAESARSVIPPRSLAKFGSRLPFAAKAPGRSHERLWAIQGSDALPASRPTPCKVSPDAEPIVHVTVRDASRFSISVGRSPRTGGARKPRSRLTASRANRQTAPKRCVRPGLFAGMAIPPHFPLLPSQDPSISTRIAGDGSGTATITGLILNHIENTWCEKVTARRDSLCQVYAAWS